jgi:LacI family sucrose operon transcriptional repressor
MLLASADNDPARELDFLRIFSNDRVDGIILSATVFTREHRSLLKKMQIPAVIVGQQMEELTSIYHDDYGAGAAMARVMLERGRRRIGFIGVLREDVAVGQRRYEGFRDELQKAGISLSESMKETADFCVASGYERMRSLHAAFPELDAVICATDQIALGAINYLKEQGLRVPGDIAVAGFGDNLLSSYTTPAITTVHFYYRQSGERAAMEMLSDLEEERRSPRSICLGYELMIRESV